MHPLLKKIRYPLLCACVDSETQNEGVRIIRSLEYHPANNLKLSLTRHVYGFRFHVNDVLKLTEQSLGWIYV